MSKLILKQHLDIFETILDFLKINSISKPYGYAFVHLLDGNINGNTDSIRNFELYDRVEILANYLVYKGIKKGDVVLLMYPTGIDFIVAFYACLRIGCVSVPLYPIKNNNSVSRVVNVVQNSKAKYLLTVKKLVDSQKKIIERNNLSKKIKNLNWVETDLISIEDGFKRKKLSNKVPELAYLQYTSGSTGNPKGVMVSHSNILHNVKMIVENSKSTKRTVSVIWLPHFHDMGLLTAVIQPIFCGYTSYIMSPADFSISPFSWLKIMTNLKATYSSVPNFALDECIERINEDQLKDLDLTALEVIFNGAEPIRAQSITAFNAKFKKVGLKTTVITPAYGLAETTLKVTAGTYKDTVTIENFCKRKISQNCVFVVKEDHKDVIKMVGCGQLDPDKFQVKIVDPNTQEMLPADQIGEVWVAGKSVTLGYWENQSATEEIYGYKLAGYDDLFLRTGDLGFIYENELYISGRLKDVIIIKGQNFYPQDIEAVVTTNCTDITIGGGAAFSLQIIDQEEVIFIQEVTRTAVRFDDKKKEQIAKSIFNIIGKEFGFFPAEVVLITPKSLSKTSSGKITRSRCKADFIGGKLKSIYNYNSRVNHLEESVKSLIKNENINVNSNFFELGLSSFQITSVASLLSKQLQKEISLSDLYEYASISNLLANLNDKKGLENTFPKEYINSSTNSSYWKFICNKGSGLLPDRRLYPKNKKKYLSTFKIKESTDLKTLAKEKGFFIEEIFIASIASSYIKLNKTMGVVLWINWCDYRGEFFLNPIKGHLVKRFPLVLGRRMDLIGVLQEFQKQIRNAPEFKYTNEDFHEFPTFDINLFIGFEQYGLQDNLENTGDSCDVELKLDKNNDTWILNFKCSNRFGQDPIVSRWKNQLSSDLVELSTKLVQKNIHSWYPSVVEFSGLFPDLDNLGEEFPLTDIQMAYLIGRGDAIELGGISIVNYVEFDTSIDLNILNKALNDVIIKHAALRTIFPREGFQKILQEVPEYTIRSIDIKLKSSKEKENFLKTYRSEILKEDFELAVWPLFKVEAIRFSEDSIKLIVFYDLMMCDASSAILWISDIGYHCKMMPDKIPDTEYNFRDYHLQDIKEKNKNKNSIDEAYWKSKLIDFPFAPELPYIKDFSQIKTPEFSVLGDKIEKEGWASIKRLAKDKKMMPFSLLATVFSEVLQYWSNTDRFALNLTVSDRKHYHPDVQYLAGEFTSNLLLDVDFRDVHDYWSKVEKLQKNVNKALDHRSYSGVKFTQDLLNYREARNSAIMPVVFTAMLNINDANINSFDSLGDFVYSYSRTPQVSIDLQVFENGGRLEIILGYVNQLFDENTIKEIFAGFINGLNGLGNERMSRKLKLPKRDKLIWANYNETGQDIPKTTLSALFEHQMLKTPNNVGLISEGNELTYKELDSLSNIVKQMLWSEGIGSGSVVGLIGNRNEQTIINLLGIVKSGAAYVPIDPEYPEDRKTFIIKNSNCLLVLDETKTYIINESLRTPLELSEARPKDVAYIIYTSGSTGYPKGVVTSHESACNTIIDINKRFKVSQKDKLLGISSLGFDLSVYDVFGALAVGASLVLVPNQRDVENLNRLVKRHKITIWNSVPAIMNATINATSNTSLCKTVRLVLLSGDWIPVELPKKIKKLYPFSDLISLGGATEASIWSVYFPVHSISAHWKSIPYGFPLSNQQLYVLNKNQELVPIGLEGELYIGGKGVAQEYCNLFEETENSFINHSIFGRIYRTGDFGRMSRSGYIEFLGRKDSQVKIRGFRIELAEIEKALKKIEGINEVLVSIIEIEGEREIISYLIGSVIPKNNEIRKFLVDFLPYYMIPKFFMILDSFPLSLNGKIDRKRLPFPNNKITKEGIVKPISLVQQKLHKICLEVLNLENISMKSNIFEKGANSIHATQIALKSSQIFNAEIRLVTIFKSLDILSLANNIEKQMNSGYYNIPNIALSEEYPVSPGQKRIWIEEQLLNDNFRKYNESRIFEMNGSLNIQRFTKAFEKVIEKHEILRTGYIFKNGELLQKINENLPFEIQVQKLSHGKEGFDFEDICNNFFHSRFRLEKGEVIRLKLLELSDQKNLLLICLHHISVDGWSTVNLLNEVIQHYDNIYCSPQSNINKLEVQYKDYSAWLNKRISEGIYDKSKNYWKNRFLENIPMLDFPIGVIREEEGQYKGSEARFVIPKKIKHGIERIAKNNETTLFAVLLTALKILLYKYAGQKDITIGTPVSGREHKQIENSIGFFLNTLPIRTELEPTKDFEYNLKLVNNSLIEAFEHQSYPLDLIISELDVKRNATRNLLFDVMLVLHPKLNSFEFDDILLKEIANPCPTSKFDLTLEFAEKEDELVGLVVYKTQIFSETRVNKFIEHFQELIFSFINNREWVISRLNILSSVEREEILINRNNTNVDYPKGKSLVDLYQDRVRNNRDKEFLIWKGENMSFGFFDLKVTDIAKFLSSHYLNNKNKHIAVFIDRSPEQVIALMSILKSGGAYVPIDPNYPQIRIKQIIEDAEIEIVLTNSRGERILGIYDDLLVVNIDSKIVGERAEIALPKSNDLAYIIYTSGSTGKPKGVMLNHEGVVNRLNWQMNTLNYTDDDVILQKTPFTFDVSVWEYFIPLCFTGTLALAQKEKILSTKQLMEDIEYFSVTNIHFVPTMLNIFLEDTDNNNSYNLSSLRCIICSGEALPLTTAKKSLKLFPNAELYNLYGPTEASIDVSYYKVTEDSVTIPIGKPIDNIQLYVLDKANLPQTIGVKGEICISGIGLSKGYLNMPKLTAEKFIKNPYRLGEMDEFLYKTGDLGYWSEDGNLIFLSRKDNQVKIRGFRIELEEIENVLRSIKGIKDVVVSTTIFKNENTLIAYVKKDLSLKTKILKQILKENLPEYMIPKYFINLDEFPLTVSGKLDKKALPLPDVNFNLGIKSIKKPSTPESNAIALVWRKILNVEVISMDDDFFEIGGDSIKAMQVVSALSLNGWSLSLKDIMFTSCLSELQFKLTKLKVKELNKEFIESTNLSIIEQWFFDQDLRENHYWNQAVILSNKTGFDLNIVATVIEKIISRHEQLRATYIKEGDIIKRVYQKDISQIFSIKTLLLEDGPKTEEFWEKIVSSQDSGSISKGPLVKVFSVITPNKPNKLVLSIHHLLIDGVSWRIFLDEFDVFYQSLIKNNLEISLPYPLQYKNWLGLFENYAESNFIGQEKYWDLICGNISSLKLEVENNENKTSDFKVIKANLSNKIPLQILDILRKRNFNINEVLLAAFAKALLVQFNLNTYHILVESHGRFDFNGKVELSRSIGWFTSLFGVSFSNGHVMKVVQEIQKQLKNVPALGHGYLPFIKKNKILQDRPLVCFNYLGDVSNNDHSFEMVQVPINKSTHPNSIRPFALEMVGYKGNEGLVVELNYGKELFEKKQIKKLLNETINQLKQIAELVVKEDLSGWYSGENIYDNIAYPDLELTNEPFPLTDIQMSYLLGKEMSYELGGVSTINYFEFDTELEIPKLNLALNELIQKHPMLRIIILKNGTQQITKNFKYKIVEEDVMHLSKFEAETFFAKKREEGINKSFVIETWPLFDFKVYKVSKTKHRLLICYDLMIVDAGSIFLLLSDLVHHYNNKPYFIPPTEFTFRDYRVNQLKLEEGVIFSKDKEYWRNKIEDFPEAPELPFKIDVSQVTEPVFQVKEYLIEKKKWNLIKKNVKDNKGIVTAVLATLFAEVISFWTNSNHFALNLTVAERLPMHPDVKYMIGEFTSTLLLEVDFKNKNNFWCRAKAVQNTLIEGLDHISYSGVRVIQDLIHLNKAKGKALMPIVFTSILNKESIYTKAVDELGERNFVHIKSPQVAIDMQVIEKNGELIIVMGYVEQLFDKEMINHLFDSFVNKVISFNDDLNSLNIDLPISHAKLWETYNNSSQNISEKTLIQLFEEQVNRSPNNIAINSDGELITYLELHKKSNQIANFLVSEQIKVGNYIGVLANRSIATYINILGIIKTGAAYVPLDPEYPENRRNQIKDVAKCNLILNEEFYHTNALADYDSEDLKVKITTDNVAYVIFTSGSTGTPKGVVIQHGAVANTIQDVNNQYKINETDKILGISSLGFDLSVYDFFGTLFTGAELYLIKDQRDIKEIVHKIKEHKITVWNSVPAIMDMVADEFERKSNERKKLYWLPFVIWNLDEENLIITGKSYPEFKSLFPDFFFFVSKGKTIDDILLRYNYYEEYELKVFVQNLLNQGSLSYSKRDIRKEYEYYSKLYNYFDKSILYDESVYREFKSRQLIKGQHLKCENSISIDSIPEVYSKLNKRRSSRIYKKDKFFSIKLLEGVLSESIQSQERLIENLKIYVFIKANRVAGFEEGFYVYNVENKKILLVRKTGLEDGIFSQHNLNIYNSSAFVLFFVGGKGAKNSEQYLIDAGYLSASTMWLAEEIGIGTCYIGDIDEVKIIKKIHLQDDFEILTVMTGGIPDLSKTKKSENLFELAISRDAEPNFGVDLQDENLKNYCWSLNVSWEIDGEMFLLDGKPCNVFNAQELLSIYFLTKNGCTKIELLKELELYGDSEKLLKKLLELNLIVFGLGHLNSAKFYGDISKYNSPLSFKIFSSLIGCFGQMQDSKSIKYKYPSAGGLYPIDVYIKVPENTVDNLSKGIYYFNPFDEKLILISEETDSKILTMELVYNPEANVPKYGASGIKFAYLEAGIMSATLETIAKDLDIEISDCFLGKLSEERNQNDKLILGTIGLNTGNQNFTAKNAFFSLPISTNINKTLRLVLLSGDWIPLDLPKKIKKQFSDIEIVSMGGATEASIWSIYFPVDKVLSSWSSIPYGMPMANQKIFVFGSDLKLCPIDVIGDIYIGGQGLAQEYLNDKSKTNNHYINHPIFGRVYKTGDLGVFHKEGYVEFKGRKDSQVKIRGFRIELDEIVAKLNLLSAVKNVLINIIDEYDFGKEICAYIIMDFPNEELIRSYLRTKLPYYMLPKYIVFLNEFPLTSNGKINRKLLPIPAIDDFIEAYEPPINPVQKTIEDIICKVLVKKRIGVNKNFLDIGCSSIDLMKIYQELDSLYPNKLKISDLFTHATIEALSDVLNKSSEIDEHENYFDIEL